MTDKPSTIRLSPQRRAAIDDVRHASVSRQAWVDAVIDSALEAALSKAGEGTGPGPQTPVSPASRGPAASPRAHTNAMCRSCQTLGPPKTRACEKCGHTANPKARMTP